MSDLSLIDVVVVAEVRLNRDGLARALDGADGLRVTATAIRCAELPTEALDGRSPVLVLDVPTPVPELRWVTAWLPRLRPIVLGVRDEAEIISYAEAGAVGYLPCDGTIADLVGLIEAVARGELLCSPRVAHALIRQVATLAAHRAPAVLPPNPGSRRLNGLTEREQEIVRLMAAGLSNREIAGRLFIAVATVKNHVHNVLDKLDVRSRADAAAWYQLGSGRPTPAHPDGSHSGWPIRPREDGDT